MPNKNNFRDLDTYKHSFVKHSSLTMGLLILISLSLRIFLSNFDFYRLIIPFAVGILCLLISFDSRKTGFKKIHAYLLLTGFTAIILNAGIQNGGFRAPVVAGIFIIPLIGVVLLEKKGGLIGLIINFLTIALLFILEHYNLVTPYNGNHANIFYPIVFLSISLITFTIVRAIQKAKDESDELINKMYQEIILKAQISSLVKLSEGMSHEINNPLAIISIKTQKLKENLKKLQFENRDELQKAISDLEKIQNSTDRITKVVSALFHFSHKSENETAEKFNLLEIINLSLEAVAFRGAARHIRFDLNCPKDLVISTKIGQLSQVIVNLLNNAIDALDNTDEKLIEIKTYKLNSKIFIEITDSGPGVPTELQDKILLPFFTTKEVGKGSGMGLSISLGIIQSMRGELRLDKNSKKSRFIIELPI